VYIFCSCLYYRGRDCKNSGFSGLSIGIMEVYIRRGLTVHYDILFLVCIFKSNKEKDTKDKDIGGFRGICRIT